MYVKRKKKKKKNERDWGRTTNTLSEVVHPKPPFLLLHSSSRWAPSPIPIFISTFSLSLSPYLTFFLYPSPPPLTISYSSLPPSYHHHLVVSLTAEPPPPCHLFLCLTLSREAFFLYCRCLSLCRGFPSLSRAMVAELCFAFLT